MNLVGDNASFKKNIRKIQAPRLEQSRLTPQRAEIRTETSPPLSVE